MEYRRDGRDIAIRLDEGDEVVSCIKSVCAKEGVLSASFTGIGACRAAEISHYNTKKKEYHSTKSEGMIEIVSLIGNVTDAGPDGPLVHAHIALGLESFHVIGGHLVSAAASPTCEISIHIRGIRIGRKHDEGSGLRLQEF